MSVSHAILIAVEESDGLPPVPFAAEEIRALAARLESIGFAKSKQTILTGAAASRSAIESRLRKLSAVLSTDDTAWFVFAGPAFVENGLSHLACADTLGDDRAATSLALADLVKHLTATGATLRFLLDAPGLSDDELATLFPTDGNASLYGLRVITSHAANGRRLWLQLVGDVLAGQVPDVLDDGNLTAGALRDWTAKELPRAIRKAISSPKAQTPGLFGPSDAVLAHIKAAKPSAKLDLKQLKRIVFRGEARDRVKNLAGLQRTAAEAATPSARNGSPPGRRQPEAIVEDTYSALRSSFSNARTWNRRSARGLAFIHTPRSTSRQRQH